MRILRYRDRLAVPWKNGGGVTREVAAYPEGADLEDIGWRVSIATVERGGPFSVFPGIDRHIALFEGAMTLDMGSYGVGRLSRDSAPFSFPGDAPLEAQVLQGPVTDLNVMTRRGAFTARLSRRVMDGDFLCKATTFVFPLARASLPGGEIVEVFDALQAGARERIGFAAPVECYVAEIFPAR